MSVLALNRIRILEEKVAALLERVQKLEENQVKSQACEERPHTLSIRKKADTSHA